MKILHRYIFKNILIATVFTAVVLVGVIFLSQSLRFLDLIISSGASSASFWMLTLLILPRFFEIILPLSLMAAILFTYSRMMADSEFVIMKSAGLSLIRLSKSAFLLAGISTFFLLAITLWIAPKSAAQMQSMRQTIKAQLSSYLFREGVFTKAGKGLMVYISERAENGELIGLIIHDQRDKNKNPSTVIARRGNFFANENGYKVLVYEGARQEFDKEKRRLSTLNFEQYTIELPDKEPVRIRWAEPDERTLFELLSPDMTDTRDVESIRDFRVELHRRFVGPFMALTLSALSVAFLLLGQASRRGQASRITAAVGTGIVIQSLFLMAYDLSRTSNLGLFFMYILVFVPIFVSLSLIYTPMRREILRFLSPLDWRRT